MTRSRERLAWLILLVSFILCAGITISIPVGISTFVQRATRPLTIFVQTSQGTILRDNGLPIGAFDAAQDVKAPTRLTTNNRNDLGVVEWFTPDTFTKLGRVQIYGTTNISIDAATSPRFESSENSPGVSLTLNSGRVVLSVPPTETSTTPLVVNVSSPQGNITIQEPGEYSLEVFNAQTQLSVRNGIARINDANDGEALLLINDQRVVIDADGSVSGPLNAERNLVQNGDFDAGLDSWLDFQWTVERDDQPTGETTVEDLFGEPTLRFRRNGIGNASDEVRQEINRDVLDFSELRLVVSFRVSNQSLDVCGFQGTECPLTIRVRYQDEFGQSLAWQQGFYAKSDPAEAQFPGACLVCGPPLNLSQHVKISKAGDIVLYESDNLLDLLGQEGWRPARIDTISLIAAGHTFEVDVVDVALIAKE